MKSTFVICFHTARIHNLLQTLRFLVQDHQEVVNQSQLITVCQNSMDYEPWDYIKEFKDLQSGFLRADHFDMEVDQMKLPVLTNFGVSYADSQKVIVLESDRILPPGYFAKVIDRLEPKVCITCQVTHKLSKPASDEEIRNNNYEFKEDRRDENNQLGMRNMWSGNTAIWKQDYMDVDKMDEGYIGYGWADSDMTRTMSEFGVKSVFLPDIELHLWHPSATYGAGDQKMLFIENGLRFCEKWNIKIPDWLNQEILEHKKNKRLMI